MFNQAGFNRQNFNRITVFEAFLSAVMSAEGLMSSVYIRGTPFSGNFSADSAMMVQMVQVVLFDSTMTADSVVVADNMRVIAYDMTASAESILAALFQRDIPLGGSMASESDLSAHPNVMMVAVAEISADSGLVVELFRALPFSAMGFQDSDVSATAITVITNGAELSAESSMVVSGRRYQVQQIIFTGDLAPGEQIAINSKYLKVTQDGQNARHLIDGNFLTILPDVNTFEYIDSETGRTVKIRVTHRDRFV